MNPTLGSNENASLVGARHLPLLGGATPSPSFLARDIFPLPHPPSGVVPTGVSRRSQQRCARRARMLDTMRERGSGGSELDGREDFFAWYRWA